MTCQIKAVHLTRPGNRCHCRPHQRSPERHSDPQHQHRSQRRLVHEIHSVHRNHRHHRDSDPPTAHDRRHSLATHHLTPTLQIARSQPATRNRVSQQRTGGAATLFARNPVSPPATTGDDRVGLISFTIASPIYQQLVDILL